MIGRPFLAWRGGCGARKTPAARVSNACYRVEDDMHLFFDLDGTLTDRAWASFDALRTLSSSSALRAEISRSSFV
jgi:hypothetical protein